MTRLATNPGAGLIAIPDSFLLVNRAAIVEATLRHRLPAVFGFAESGGLLEYATDTEDLFRHAASYLDRILRGASPSDLPVQVPGHNLLARLEQRRGDVLRFLHDLDVPFTNNDAEPDARMMKMRQKIPGGFRADTSAEDFAVIRSALSTARKQGWNILHTLTQDAQTLTRSLKLTPA